MRNEIAQEQVLTKEDEKIVQTLAAKRAIFFLETLKNTFFSKYVAVFGSLDSREKYTKAVQQTALILMDLNQEQIDLGYKRLETATFCPTATEFKSWCVAADYLNADLAWGNAYIYSTDNKHPISQITHDAYCKISQLLTSGKISDAKFNFISVYNALVENAKSRGEKDHPYVKPKKSQTKALPVKNSKVGVISERDAHIGELTKNYMSQGMSFLEASKLARHESGATEVYKQINMGGNSKTPGRVKPAVPMTRFQQLIAQGKTPVEAFNMAKAGTA